MRRARRRHILALLGIAAAAGVSLPIMAATAGPGTRAPDLRADPVEAIEGPQVYFVSGLGANQLLVRFDGFVTNIGSGPLEISGNPQIPGGVQQKAWAVGQTFGQFATIPIQPANVKFETGDGHNHFHLAKAMRYGLWTLDHSGQVAPGQKVGFCLYDIQPAPGYRGPNPAPADQPTYTGDVTHFCDQNDPGATSLTMGTQPGWRDVYDKSLAYQWVDVSNTAPGRYVVGAESDPDNTLWEGGGAAETNAPAFADANPVTIPGWTAQPVSLAQTGGAQAVPVTSQKFGTQGDSNLRYRVTSAPAHGSLNVAVGQDFAASTQLVYTPSPGYLGADSFTYAARSVTSNFPLSPPNATVTIADSSPVVTISGAPATMVAGTSVQLSAALRNLTGGVKWTDSAGSVSTTGRYTAPGTPPKGGMVTVKATSTANPAVAGAVAILIKPKPKQTSRPDVFANLSAGNRLLSRLAIRKISSKVFVGKVVTGRKGGRVTITTTFGPKVLGRCSARIGARKGLTCKVTLRRSYPLKKVRMTARFVAKRGGGVAVRRAFVVR